jgi:hypothetical protein
MNFYQAEKALDKIIQKSRVHLYKPIQIAEILYRDRTSGDIDLENLETYRNPSKKWRDEVSIRFLGRICTSSQKFQDNLFENNAIPPEAIKSLAKENKETNGKIEAYIYDHLRQKHYQMSEALLYCIKSKPKDFKLNDFLNMFRYSPGLKRSIDKIYEIVVFALFSVLVKELNITITIDTDKSKIYLLKEFDDFAEKVLCISKDNPSFKVPARLYRVGVTNAADRGLDMWANFGPAIQVKHLTLNLEMAQGIVSAVCADRVVVICKTAEKDVILSILNQIGWGSRVQSIITEDELESWYDKALRGQFSESLGGKLLSCLEEEIGAEFPVTNVKEFDNFYNGRGYKRFEFKNLNDV